MPFNSTIIIIIIQHLALISSKLALVFNKLRLSATCYSFSFSNLSYSGVGFTLSKSTMETSEQCMKFVYLLSTLNRFYTLPIHVSIADWVKLQVKNVFLSYCQINRQFLMFNLYKSQSFSTLLASGHLTNTAESQSSQNTQLLVLEEMAY